MTRRQVVWVVECRIHDDDPAHFGPYTERQAERVAARICAEVALATDEWGTTHHPSGIENAYAFPMGRFEHNIGWMTTEEKREARAMVREVGQRVRERESSEEVRGHLE